MDVFSELQTAVQSDLNVDATSTLFDLTTVKLAINRAYHKIGGLFRWPETEDAKKTSTIASQDYYDYPDNWKPESVWKLEVDGIDYGDPLVFKDYIYEIDNDFPHLSSPYYVWTSQWRRYFIYPTPTTNGSNNISVWGQKAVDALTLQNDPTIFSYSLPECNEAVVLEAVAILRAKGEDTNTALFKSSEAKQILTIAWNKIRQDKTKYEKTTPFFEVPDYYRNKLQDIRNKIGNF